MSDLLKAMKTIRNNFTYSTYSSTTFQENLTVFSLSLKELGHPFPESVNDPRK